MNDKPPRKSQAWAWVLCIMTMPVFYILSTPWVISYGYKFHVDQCAAIRCYLVPIQALPADSPFWPRFYKPYFDWCWKTAGLY